jgi:hypothetical protein
MIRVVSLPRSAGKTVWNPRLRSQSRFFHTLHCGGTRLAARAVRFGAGGAHLLSCPEMVWQDPPPDGIVVKLGMAVSPFPL